MLFLFCCFELLIYVFLCIKKVDLVLLKFKDLVFDRFVQGDKSLNRKKEGSGIGLALVKSLIEFHSGSIEINKEYKDGTEFILKLPNIKIEEKDLKINNDIDVEDKKIIEKINNEFSDIYELRN